jgi:hypothetical protein
MGTCPGWCRKCLRRPLSRIRNYCFNKLVQKCEKEELKSSLRIEQNRKRCSFLLDFRLWSKTCCFVFGFYKEIIELLRLLIEREDIRYGLFEDESKLGNGYLPRLVPKMPQEAPVTY